MTRASAKVISEKSSASHLAVVRLAAGSAAVAIAPIAGTAAAAVSRGNDMSDTPHQQGRGDENGGPAQHLDRVRADEAALQLAQQAGESAHGGRRAVDRAVHQGAVELDEGRGDPA